MQILADRVDERVHHRRNHARDDDRVGLMTVETVKMVILRDLHTERVDPAAAAGGKIGAVNMTVLNRNFRHRAVLLCVSSSIAHVVSLANSLIVLYNIIKLIYYKEEFSWGDFCIPPRRERTNPATSS